MKLLFWTIDPRCKENILYREKENKPPKRISKLSESEAINSNEYFIKTQTNFTLRSGICIGCPPFLHSFPHQMAHKVKRNSYCGWYSRLGHSAFDVVSWSFGVFQTDKDKASQAKRPPIYSRAFFSPFFPIHLNLFHKNISTLQFYTLYFRSFCINHHLNRTVSGRRFILLKWGFRCSRWQKSYFLEIVVAFYIFFFFFLLFWVDDRRVFMNQCAGLNAEPIYSFESLLVKEFIEQTSVRDISLEIVAVAPGQPSFDRIMQTKCEVVMSKTA